MKVSIIYNKALCRIKLPVYILSFALTALEYCTSLVEIIILSFYKLSNVFFFFLLFLLYRYEANAVKRILSEIEFSFFV